MNNMLNKKYITITIIVLLIVIIYQIVKPDTMPKNIGSINENILKNIIKPAQGRITGRVGMRKHPITGVQKFHNGTDIANVENTPLYAIADGVVTGVNYSITGGKQLFIQHDNGLKSGYAHCNNIIKSVNQRVKRGDIVAYMGNTGASTGVHLHFTLKDTQGNYLDISKLYNT